MPYISAGIGPALTAIINARDVPTVSRSRRFRAHLPEFARTVLFVDCVTPFRIAVKKNRQVNHLPVFGAN
jgi:hypothetical protein